MTFKEWKAYYKSLRWNKKWFPLMILLRPVIDNFYTVKEYSLFLSPVYIAGVITPILMLWALKNARKRIMPGQTDEFIKVWGAFIFINCFILLLVQLSLVNFGNAIKYITAPLLFFYARFFIRNKQDIYFILTTFLISCSVPLLVLMFETFVHPIDPHYLSTGRGGGSRLRGNYGDSMSYAVYFIGAFLVAAYFYLDKTMNSDKKIKKKGWGIRFLFVLFVVFYGITQIRMTSTWIVFLILGVLFMYYNSAQLKGFATLLVVSIFILPIIAVPVYEKEIRPLLQKEINVINGDTDVEYAFDGRVSRWQRYMEIWHQMPLLSKALGAPSSNFKQASTMVSGGMHNDYIRQMFLSGVIGVVCYVISLLLIMRRSKFFRTPEKFLIVSSSMVILLFSMSTMPTLYLGMMNYIFPVFAFACLPRSRVYPVMVPVKNIETPLPAIAV